MGGCWGAAVASALADPRPNAHPVPSNDVVDWLVFGDVFLTSAIALVAGCLLFVRQAGALRLARVLLLAAAVGWVSQAVLIIPATLQASRSSSTGGLTVIVTGPMFILALLWGVVSLIAAVKLGRRLKDS
jgi:hypothetical protein